MGRKNFNAFIKRQKAEKKRKKKEEKKKKLKEQKEEESSGKLKDMVAYIDEEGNITDTPPEDMEAIDEKINKQKKSEQ